MSSIDVDEILNKLSIKFNKIFYDREFVCCVNQDFQVVLENKNSCCVVVFPVLGPNYLKAVRYQAKIFDLAVFTLGAGRNRAIAVCQKEFLRKNPNEVVETKVQIMPQSSKEKNGSKLRKKRPERQLYIPPAQRRLPLNIEEIPYKTEKCTDKVEAVHSKQDTNPKISRHLQKTSAPKRQSVEKYVQVSNDESENEKEKEIRLDYLFSTDYVCILWNYKISKQNYVTHQFFKFSNNFYSDRELPLYSRRDLSNALYILNENSVAWQPKLNVSKHSATYSDTSRTCPMFDFEAAAIKTVEYIEKKTPLVDHYKNEELLICQDLDYSELNAFKISWDESRRVSESDVFLDLSVINCGHSFVINTQNGCNYFYECTEDHEVYKCYLNKKKEAEETKLSESTDHRLLIKSDVIILEDRTSNGKVKKNNDKNNSPTVNIRNGLIDTTNKLLKSQKKSNDHEQEKEIMRKTKENINRKSRPIMKYVDDTADTLQIDKIGNVNNWEDLFDDDGQLQEELFKEVVHKVGGDVTIVKAKEDYSEYITKQSEELEHMVELYDFPSSFETHDIIQAFSVINSEAMYVKWVDDTHAILVLGSLTQAQRAIELDNPLIKARPMACASGLSLETAYKHDLKPAMKRPQTNLQTARRLITTHLGTKSRVSREQNAKERDDLKAARELKKLARKNEQDAWEGKLRSTIH